MLTQPDIEVLEVSEVLDNDPTQSHGQPVYSLDLLFHIGDRAHADEALCLRSFHEAQVVTKSKSSVCTYQRSADNIR
ncbi:hypothetical protein [Paraburkholderia xenovorans]|uniref:hypothetical protein n=1 Tax=Paraburkholderia xenovorans TaxID=36873 RepID=UPI00142F2900|nr:hypothetical protein [Paraburkholderia xenovorans]